jgi:hypothetical protein
MRAGKGGRVWLGSLQSTPILVTCHTPWIVGVVSRSGLSALHTSEVLAVSARAIANTFMLSFIFVPLVDLALLLLAFLESSLLSCHFWPFTGVLREI